MIGQGNWVILLHYQGPDHYAILSQRNIVYFSSCCLVFPVILSRYWAMDILFSSLSICRRFIARDNLDFSNCFSSSSPLSESDSSGWMSISLSTRENGCFLCMGKLFATWIFRNFPSCACFSRSFQRFAAPFRFILYFVNVLISDLARNPKKNQATSRLSNTKWSHHI